MLFLSMGCVCVSMALKPTNNIDAVMGAVNRTKVTYTAEIQILGNTVRTKRKKNHRFTIDILDQRRHIDTSESRTRTITDRKGPLPQTHE